LKNDKANILNDFKTQMDEFKKLVADTTKMNINVNDEMIKVCKNYSTHLRGLIVVCVVSVILTIIYQNVHSAVSILCG